MRFTGERVIPGRGELLPMLQEHLVRYEFATPFVQGAMVIDLGCGCGYGSHALADNGATAVTGVDSAADAITYSQKHYGSKKLHFAVMDVTALTYPDHSFDVAVCFEVLEHVQNPDALLREAKRVLKPGGTFILSTPNKDIWSAGQPQPINPWHVEEFTRTQFKELVEQHFSGVRYHVQTTDIPGIIPFILFNLRLQKYYVNNPSPLARFTEGMHGIMMQVATLPPRLIPGAMDKNPNVILPETNVVPDKQYYFVAVATA